MKDKILLYLASGVKPAQVASIVGCSPGYVSQLLKDDEFKAALEAKILTNPVAVDEALQNKYDAVEHQLLATISTQAPMAEFRDAVRGLEIIAKIQDMKAQRRNPILANGATTNVQVVQLTLPASAIRALPNFVMNSENEILAIDEKSLAPLSSDGVKNLFAQLKEKREADLKVVTEL